MSESAYPLARICRLCSPYARRVPKEGCSFAGVLGFHALHAARLARSVGLFADRAGKAFLAVLLDPSRTHSRGFTRLWKNGRDGDT